MTSEITSDSNAGPQLVIWGTDVVISHCKEKFKRFIMKYVEQDVQMDEQFDGMDISQPYYLQRLEEVGQIEIPHQYKFEMFVMQIHGVSLSCRIFSKPLIQWYAPVR